MESGSARASPDADVRKLLQSAAGGAPARRSAHIGRVPTVRRPHPPSGIPRQKSERPGAAARNGRWAGAAGIGRHSLVSERGLTTAAAGCVVTRAGTFMDVL